MYICVTNVLYTLQTCVKVVNWNMCNTATTSKHIYYTGLDKGLWETNCAWMFQMFRGSHLTSLYTKTVRNFENRDCAETLHELCSLRTWLLSDADARFATEVLLGSLRGW